MRYLLALIFFAFTVNLPFGYLRNRAPKYSFRWFLFIHMPIPFIVIARLMSHLDFRFIPLFVLASVAGQFFGGKIEVR